MRLSRSQLEMQEEVMIEARMGKQENGKSELNIKDKQGMETIKRGKAKKQLPAGQKKRDRHCAHICARPAQ